MMRPVVVDASVAVAMARDEPGGAAARAAIQGWKRAGRPVMIPSHFWLEVVNSLVRRHRWPGTEVIGAIHDLDRSRLQTVQADRASLLLALDRAERFGLTAYDAAYLALTESVDGELLTFDEALRIAAGDRAVALGRQLSENPAAYEHDVTWPNYKGASAYLAKLRAEALRPTTTG
jgi:predicted nucleic acid-binding protein